MAVIRGGQILDGSMAPLSNIGQTPIAVLRVASAVQDGEAVTIGADVYEVDTHADPGVITAGRIRLKLDAGSTVKAAGTLTLVANPGDAETVTIGAKVYTFQATLTNVDGNVKIGASTAATLTNLIRAINLSGGTPGTDYAAAMTVHPTVTAAQGAGTTMLVTAKAGGTAGNSIVSTDGMANAGNVFDAATLGTTTAGVDPTAGEFTTALTTAINASGTERVTATRVSANEVLINAANARNGTPTAEARVTTLAETLAGANNAWDTAALRGGALAEAVNVSIQQRVPNAAEVAIGNMHFLFPAAPVAVLLARVVPTATPGAPKAWDGGLTITGNRITLDNAGATDWAATDTVTLMVAH